MIINNTQQQKIASPLMFDRIAARYDLANAVISLGQHARWRRQMAIGLPPGRGLRVLDLACGTGDAGVALLRSGADIHSIIGVDLSEKMMAVGRERIARAGLADRYVLQTGDAMDLPFAQAQFDAVIVAFGLRNMPDLARALIQAWRVLRPGGRLIVLEFGSPVNSSAYFFYRFYLDHILPFLGGSLTGDGQAYRYLEQTIRSFPFGERFGRILEQTGFKVMVRKEFMLGAVALYCGEKVL